MGEKQRHRERWGKGEPYLEQEILWCGVLASIAHFASLTSIFPEKINFLSRSKDSIS